MSMLNKHIVELLTESKFTTVAVYFQTEANAKQVTSAPAPSMAPMPAPVRGKAPPAPWDIAPPQLNEISETELKAQFPFIERAVPNKLFTYKCSHEMAKQLSPGDQVVVNSSENGFMIGRVWLVHDSAQIDYTAHYAYRWLVQRIDTSEFDDHMRREREFLHQLEESEKERQRRAIRENLLASVRPTDPQALEQFQASLRLLGVADSDVVVEPAPGNGAA